MTRETARKAEIVMARLTERYEIGEHPGRLAPVDELVCTILSQNTTDAARDRAFTRLVRDYPDWQAVRDAPVREIEDRIRVCGLANQKAAYIKAALAAVTPPDGGEPTLDFLRDMDVEEARRWLMEIDGVGIKTASIVLLFALDMPALPVDTHVHRVAGRLGLLPKGTSAAKAHHVLEAAVAPEHYLPFHMALIHHGRALCRARRPRCEECPLTDVCDWFAESSPG